MAGFRTGGRRWPLLATMAAVAATVVAVASAEVLDPTGVIQACADKSSGTLRVFDPPSIKPCGSKEIPLAWYSKEAADGKFIDDIVAIEGLAIHEGDGTSGVVTIKIADLGVTTAKLADDAVTTAKLADGAVTTTITDAGCREGDSTSRAPARRGCSEPTLPNAGRYTAGPECRSAQSADFTASISVGMARPNGRRGHPARWRWLMIMKLMFSRSARGASATDLASGIRSELCDAATHARSVVDVEGAGRTPAPPTLASRPVLISR